MKLILFYLRYIVLSWHPHHYLFILFTSLFTYDTAAVIYLFEYFFVNCLFTLYLFTFSFAATFLYMLLPLPVRLISFKCYAARRHTSKNFIVFLYVLYSIHMTIKSWFWIWLNFVEELYYFQWSLQFVTPCIVDIVLSGLSAQM